MIDDVQREFMISQRYISHEPVRPGMGRLRPRKRGGKKVREAIYINQLNDFYSVCVFFVYFLYTVVAWRRLVAGQGRDNLASHSVSLRDALTMIVFSVEFSRRHIHV